jgi:Ca2+-transporting ATPase
MDLAASTSFVAEPAESDLLKQNPRDPRELSLASVAIVATL